MSETQLASMFIGSADDGDGIDRGRPSGAGNMIHIVNPQTSEILDYITLDNIIDDTHKKSLESYLETYDAIVLGGDDFSYDKYLEKRNHIIIPDEDGTYQEFVLFEVDKYRDTEGRKTHFYAHATYLELKKAKVIYPTRREGFTLSQHAGWALNDTGWRVGIVESEGVRTFNIENHTNPYEFIKRLANEFEVEIRFRVEHDGRRITARYVDFLERIGDWKGREVEFGRDLDSIRRIEKQDVVTALLGLGPEKEDGTRLEVLVEDEEALQRWGRVDEHGNLHHLIEPYEIQSERTEMTEEEARQYTRTALDKRINTQVTYETTILDLEEVPGLEHEKIRFGDTIRIKDTYFNPPLYIEARVYEIERSIKNKAKKDIKLGDYIEYTEEEVHAIWRQLRNQIRRRITAAQLVEYAEPKKVESSTPPPIKEGENPIWVDTSKTPHVPHVVIANKWVKMSPTEAQEVGAETPQGAQEKADTAEQNAKSYTDIIKSDLEDGIQQALTTADGKNSIFPQPTAPSTVGRKIGDVWFDTSRGNLMHRFDGTKWVEAKWGEQSIVANSITANHIKSLVGLNVNDQFIVDSQGNVKFAGSLEGATGTFSGDIEGATIRGSSFSLQQGSGNFSITPLGVEGKGSRTFSGVTREGKYSITWEDGPYQIPLPQILLSEDIFDAGRSPNILKIQPSTIIFEHNNSLMLNDFFTFDIDKAKFTGSVEIDSFNNVLWTGQVYLLDTHHITPTKRLDECTTGWILQWQRYEPGVGIHDTDFQFYHLPKATLKNGSGRSHIFNGTRFDTRVRKIFYPTATQISGHSGNGDGDNRQLVLTAIYEY